LNFQLQRVTYIGHSAMRGVGVPTHISDIRLLKVEGSFTILKKDPAFYPHTCLGPVTYMGTVVTKWAMQCLAWDSMLHTVEAIKQFVDVLNKHSRRQVLAAQHPYK
jgi:hypothetical protein